MGSRINTFCGFFHSSVVMSTTTKIPFYWGTGGENARKKPVVLLVRNKFPSVRAEGRPDFALRRWRFDVLQFLKGRPENVNK
jgi:hypothetical protein